MLCSETEAEQLTTDCKSKTHILQVDCPVYINNVTSGAAADIVKRRKDKGVVVFGEVTPAGLACDGTNYWNKVT